jgi:hypothetical protein
MTLTRVPSRLSPELDNLVEAAIGCCLTVHRELGPGMNERIYARAYRIELETLGLSYDAERPVPIRYLRATGLHVALVVNFNVALIKQGIRRVVL